MIRERLDFFGVVTDKDSMDRYLQKHLLEFASKKIILLSGPRQVGKTTMSKMLSSSFAYYNYDQKKDLRVFQEQEWDRSKSLVIFDELHKMKKWKLWLKGIFDLGDLKAQKILVTGSARLDIAKKMGDSLAGRFFSYRLHPLDLKELKNTMPMEKAYKRLLSYGGFPEPFFEGNERFYQLWQKTHSDLILRQDLFSLEHVRDLDGIELLVEMLASRVGSVVSFNSLAEDLDRDDKTIKRWVQILESLYIIFRVSPNSKNIARALKKASKFYFYDVGKVNGDESAKLENLVALALRKELDFQADVYGKINELHFLQTKDKQEIDFLVLRKGEKPLLLEVKLSEGKVSKNFAFFRKVFKSAEQIQIVKNLDREYQTKEGVVVRSALEFLGEGL